jgi:hypothetical protein
MVRRSWRVEIHRRIAHCGWDSGACPIWTNKGRAEGAMSKRRLIRPRLSSLSRLCPGSAARMSEGCLLQGVAFFSSFSDYLSGRPESP